jgi:hypothetical protein
LRRPFEGSTPDLVGLAGACRVLTHKLRGRPLKWDGSGPQSAWGAAGRCDVCGQKKTLRRCMRRA